MRNRDILVFPSLAFALIFGVSTPSRMQAQDNSEPSAMLPLDQYLMDRDAEIAMARSAAPPSIGKDATVSGRSVWPRGGIESSALQFTVPSVEPQLCEHQKRHNGGPNNWRVSEWSGRIL